MKKIPLLSALFISALSIHAQTKKESIKALFVLMHQGSLLTKSMDIMSSSMIKSISSNMKDSTHFAETSKIMAASMEKSKNLAIKIMNEDMVDIYDKYFNEKEIDDFVAFYKSKSGQQMINKLPDIQKEIMDVMAVKFTPVIQQDVMKAYDELHKNGAQPK